MTVKVHLPSLHDPRHKSEDEVPLLGIPLTVLGKMVTNATHQSMQAMTRVMRNNSAAATVTGNACPDCVVGNETYSIH